MPVELATFAMAIDARGMTAGGDAAQKELREVDVEAKKVDKSLKETEKATGFLGRGFVRLTDHVKSVVAAYAGYATVRKFAEELAGVDRAMAGLEARTGLSSSSAEFRELAEAAEDLALSSEFGVAESIAGLEALRRSGFTTAESIREIGSVAAYAEQSQKSLAATARDVGDEIRIFGLEAKDAGRFVDVMTVAARRGRTEVPELDAALRGVAASANEAGLSFEDTVSLLAQLTAQGIPASEAGSKLEQVLQRVAKAAGVDGVAGALRDLDRSEFRAPLFIAALERGIEGLDAFKDGLKDVEGAAKQADDVLDDTIGGRLSELNAALTTFANNRGFANFAKGTIEAATDAARFAAGEDVGTMKAGLTRLAELPSLSEFIKQENDAADDLLVFTEYMDGFDKSTANAAKRTADLAASTKQLAVESQAFDQIQTLTRELSAMQDALDARRELIGLSEEERKIQEVLAEARKAASKEYDDGTVAQAEALKKFEEELRSVVALESEAAKQFSMLRETAISKPYDESAFFEVPNPLSAEDARGKGVASMSDLNAIQSGLLDRQRLAGLAPEEADIQQQIGVIREAVQAAYGDNAEAAAQVNAKLEEQLRLTVEIESEAKKSAERAKEIGQAIGTPIKSALNDAAMSAFMGEDIDWTALGQQAGAQIAVGLIDAILISPLVDTIASALGGVINGLIEAATEALAQQAAAQGILSLLLLENGGIVSNGDVEPFAYGGIVNTPTLFPLRRGKLGLMGEAGPEAIMPLARGSDGNLGVRSFGGGTTINVYTPDADSFRKSEPHIIADMKRRERRYA